MPHPALLLFRVLTYAEPLLTVLALGAFLRVRREVDMPSMRDYLVVRTIWALLMTSLLLTFPSRLMGVIYFYLFWAGTLLLGALLLRIGLAALDRFLWSFPGLLALRKIGYRWFLIVASLLTVPVLYALTYAIICQAQNRAGWWSGRLNSTVCLVEFLAIAIVTIIGIRAGLSLRSRMFGILAGLGVEPAAKVLLTWFSSGGIWTWSNLAGQIVTDSTLILWIVYLLLPDHGGPLNEPSEAVLRWDQVARWAMRERPGAKEDASSRTHQRHRVKAA